MDNLSVKPVKAWECIGCGRIEAPQPCLGVCQDRKIELVPGEAFRELVAERDRLRADNAAMRELVLRLARTTPHDMQWEAGYRAVQERAQRLLATLERRSARD